jgi:glycosyltransferase involved in cell wall biosynthesis
MEQSSIRELGDYAIVIGRLSPEKGILELLKTWVKIPEIPLKIIGDGPLRHTIQDFVAEHHLNNVEVCGFKPHEESMRLLRKARCLIMPSLWYETFGRGIMEAYANEVPVIVSRLGAMAELVDEGVTGFTFDANAFEEVPGLVLKLFNDLALNKVMGAKAKELAQQRYASTKNYQQLYSIYDSVIEQRQIRRG